MKKTVTSLCVTAALAVTPAIGYACSGSSDSGSASAANSQVTAAKNKKKLKKCKNRAYARYQGPDLTKALKKCQRKFG
jgi:tetrahydromethanopterin S-methyltransferase subunit E